MRKTHEHKNEKPFPWWPGVHALLCPALPREQMVLMLGQHSPRLARASLLRSAGFSLTDHLMT